MRVEPLDEFSIQVLALPRFSDSLGLSFGAKIDTILSQMKCLPLAEVSALQPFVAYLAANGGDVLRYSDRAGIPRGMMETLEGRVTKVQATNFLEFSREIEGVPDLGFRVGESFGPDQMGALGCAMRGSATLGEALDILAVHLKDWWGGTRAWVDRCGDRAWLRVIGNDKLGLPRDVANQNGIFILIHIIQLAAGDGWIPARIRIPKTQGNLHEQHRATGQSEPVFDSEEIAVEFPASLLAEPLLEAPTASNASDIQQHPLDAIEALSGVLQDQVLHGHVPGFATAADIAATSKRTLQRRLADEGLTYRRLLDRIRFSVARERLIEDLSAPVKEVARIAGFSNSGNFIRSFRRMTGMTPGEYRLRSQIDRQ